MNKIDTLKIFIFVCEIVLILEILVILVSYSTNFFVLLVILFSIQLTLMYINSKIYYKILHQDDFNYIKTKERGKLTLIIVENDEQITKELLNINTKYDTIHTEYHNQKSLSPIAYHNRDIEIKSYLNEYKYHAINGDNITLFVRKPCPEFINFYFDEIYEYKNGEKTLCFTIK